METDVQAFLEHAGVKGMKWGVRRNSNTGVRPIAKTLSNSKFGKLAQRNVDRHNRAKSQRTEKKKTRIAERQAAGKARIERLKSGKGTFKDKLIRDLDIGGTNTAVRGPASGKKRIAMGVAGAGFAAAGAIQINSLLKETGHMHLG